MTLAGQAADEAGLPADPVSARPWSRLEWLVPAGAAARPAAVPPARRLGLGPPAGRPARGRTRTRPGRRRASDAVPGPGEPVSFAAHIKPLFREHDRQSMAFAFDLWSQDDVRAHAAGILARLRNGTMPCDGAWPQEQIEVFRRWTESGYQP